jgi:hypothetical protein
MKIEAQKPGQSPKKENEPSAQRGRRIRKNKVQHSDLKPHPLHTRVGSVAQDQQRWNSEELTLGALPNQSPWP